MAFKSPRAIIARGLIGRKEGTGCALCNNAIFAAIDETKSC